MHSDGRVACVPARLQQAENAQQFSPFHADGIARAIDLAVTVLDDSRTRREFSRETALAVEIFVDFHALALGSRRDERIDVAFLQAALHDVGRATGNRRGEDVLVEHIEQVHGCKSPLTVAHLVVEHPQQAIVAQQVPEHVVLLVFEHHRGVLLLKSSRRSAVDVGVLRERRVEEPARIAEYFVEQELHGSLLLLFLHVSECFLAVADDGILHIHTAHVGQHVVEIKAPL